MVYAVIRYRNRKGSRAHYEPESTWLEKQLTLWTSVGIALLLAPGLYAWDQFVTIPEDASVVEAVGQQWQWSSVSRAGRRFGHHRCPGDRR
jgi:cytochrome c oxidase subunit 2